MHENQHVLSFWFDEIKPSMWWKKDKAFDQLILERFGEVHQRAVCGELYGWRTSPGGRLAEIIVLDQFSRNIHRDSARAFVYDGMALILAQEAIAAGADKALPLEQRSFLYMPFMHSESLVIHEQAMRLFATQGLEDNLRFEQRHLDILQRFGRYPHRNAALGRVSTSEEVAFLREPGSSF
ncbi:MAG TPA: DUF924 domain-containing protein [Pseudomonas xinjiangensis]|uniref:DUF924 domain-containing protein n=2 Tax=root TaxID=1 RepID=A0A7V1BP28_9GAMM|nr:DUF924 domain-containing protein [Halopseudomonas xinjiangensis]HEC48364.1 DUF924 domain-containing protein [Halopseudomonas xinjiangensis]